MKCTDCHRPTDLLCPCTKPVCITCAFVVSDKRVAGMEGASRYYCRACRWATGTRVV